jgi:predicted RNase H-like nuclease (RuvC/YqgF family)
VRQLYDENHQLTRSLSECEHQITVLSHEIDRLNGVLKLKVDASEGLEQRARTAARESDELRKKLSEY